MDFFEKAHVVKKESSRKEHKSEVAVKKRLKQMLDGYKRSDNNIINSCDDTFDPNTFNEDSSSVSGFSDLNLTNSSNDIDDTIKSLDSDGKNKKPSHIEEPKANKTSNSSKNVKLSDPSVFSLESISECEDDIESLSDNVSLEVTLDSSSLASDMISLDTSLAESTTENDFDKSELFDADGSLANKILEKLEIKGVKKRGRKRKLENQTNENIEDDITDALDLSGVQIEDSSSNADINKKAEEPPHNYSISDTNSDFVSVSASDMAAQSLCDILGEYRHPTTKNLPSESQNHSYTNNSGIFSVEDMNVEDIHDPENESIDTQLDLNSDNYLTLDETINISDIDTSINPSSVSTSAYDQTLHSDDTSEKEMSEESLDFSYLSKVKVYYGESSCILVLKHPAELYIHGKVTVKALVGTMDLFGYTLKDKLCNVYAPTYSFAHCLKTVENENISSGLFRKLASEGVSVSDAEEIVTGIGPYDGVVSLKKLSNPKMDFVESNFMAADLFSKIGKNVDTSLRKPSQLLGCSLYLTRPSLVFEEVPCWNQAVKCGLEKRSRGIMCGGKGLGKSTFLRFCVNRLLQSGPVLVIDLDPGQAEFTVAGNISATVVDKPLLGPNFTHMKTPVRMLNLGMINTMDNPRRYATAVSDLIRHCNNDEQLKSMPWLINTMGMCNAMGMKFMALIILQAQPTYLFQIESKNSKKRFETHLNPYNVMKLYEDSYKYDFLFKNIRNPDPTYNFFIASHAASSGKNKSSVPPREERYLNFLAYFGDLLKPHTTGLLGIIPFEVKLGDLHIGLNIKICQEAVTKVINGKIIALCQLTTLDNVGKVFNLRDKPLVCHGHGLIRGVDLEKDTVYILTPIPVDKLSAVDTLVYADWAPELRGQEKHLPDGITVPYRTDTTFQQRQLMFAPRRRFNPLQLLKMSRIS